MRQPPEFGTRTHGTRMGFAAPEVTTIDMTSDGRMAPPPVSRLSWPARIGIGAVLVAVIAGLAASAVILLWLASVLIPIAIAASLIAYAAMRFQVWRMRDNPGSTRWDIRLGQRRTRF